MILLAVDDDASVKPVLHGLVGYPLDGLIACATMDDDDVRRCTDQGGAGLFFNRQPGGSAVDGVSTDHAAGAQALGHVVARGLVGEQGVVLEHHANVAAVRGHMGHGVLVEQQTSAIGCPLGPSSV
ncbi:hypothetical protein G6F54_013822 [Rhizopus delemar]|nr:hypothetical protein G6F54_013822 [Rhizopus delemar]